MGMDDYRVAAFPGIRTRQSPGEAPEGKSHAYLLDSTTTACGFGLTQMQRFERLLFAEQPPSVRCSICDRRIQAVSH